MKKAVELFKAIKEARHILATFGFGQSQIKALLAGDAVSMEVDNEKEQAKLIKKYEDLGLSAHGWTSGGGHGYPDQDMVTVSI